MHAWDLNDHDARALFETNVHAERRRR